MKTARRLFSVPFLFRTVGFSDRLIRDWSREGSVLSGRGQPRATSSTIMMRNPITKPQVPARLWAWGTSSSTTT